MQEGEAPGPALAPAAEPEARRRLLQALIDAISDSPVSLIDRDLRPVAHLGGPPLSHWGIPAAQVTREPPREWLAPHDYEVMLALVREVYASGEARRVEHHFDLPAGRVWLDVRFQPIFSPHGEVEGVLGTGHDVTERRRAEDALRASELRFHSLAEAVPVGVWRTGPDTRLLWANRRLWEILDFEPGSLENLDLPSVLGRFAAEERVDARQADRLWSEAADAYREQRGNASEMRHRRRDGSERWLQVRVEPEVDAAGRFVGHVGATHDVTELKQAQQELARHRDHLHELIVERTAQLDRSQASLRRSERLAAVGTFAAGIAHQINNPIAGILLAAQYALAAPDDAERTLEALRGIADDARHCGRIVRGVLEFAHGPRAEARPCDLNAVLRLAAPQIARDAEERGALLRLELEEGLAPVSGSESALEQVVVNLAWNAIEASAREVVVHSRARDGEVELAVVDDGVGIPLEDQARVFDPLFTTRRSGGGTGLGLALAQGIVQGYGGRIELSSRPGQGTTVSVRLPLA